MLDNVAKLLGGRVIRDHVRVSGRPCGSVPEPLRVTITPWTTVWLEPGFATGACRALVVTVTVDGWLSTVPSFTMSCATYVPARSAVNVGFTAPTLFSDAVLPLGTELKLHLNVSGSPSTSVEPEPFSCTRVPTVTVWFGPALATGGVFAVVILTVAGALLTVPSLTTNWAT